MSVGLAWKSAAKSNEKFATLFSSWMPFSSDYLLIPKVKDSILFRWFEHFWSDSWWCYPKTIRIMFWFRRRKNIYHISCQTVDWKPYPIGYWITLSNNYHFRGKVIWENRSKVIMSFNETQTSKGPSLYYVRVFWGFLEPPSPLCKDIFNT